MKEEQARQRRWLGMEEAGRERLATFNEAQADWYGKCRRCGERVSGSLEDIRAHREVCDGSTDR